MGSAAQLARFYALLDALEAGVGGVQRLAVCKRGMNWPKRGVYFFFEDGEARTGSGSGRRVVRVGTHALRAGGRATLWQRLSQHRGNANGSGGNHRGSIFRLLIGDALGRQNPAMRVDSWGVKGDLGQAGEKLGLDRGRVRAMETPLEQVVCRVIGAMPFLWVAVDDPPGPDSDRGVIERNAIGLLSAEEVISLDPPSDTWLGRQSSRERVRRSGLWNNNHVGERYDPMFLNVLERYVFETKSP